MAYRWAILTGEYPPQPGGVSDYTRQLACALAHAGDDVHVWAPARGRSPSDPGVFMHRLDGDYGPGALFELDAGLRKLGPKTRLLVQYVPHMYGFKAMNVPFCAWLAARRRPAPWVMFHEVAFPIEAGQRLRHNLLGHVHHLMARLAARSAERIFVAIPRWGAQLQALTGWHGAFTWLPIPSTMPTQIATAAAEATRRSLLADCGDVLLGHFGTYGGPITQMLDAALPSLLDRAGRVAVMLGRGSTGFVAALCRRHPQFASRCIARPDLPAHDVACHLAACDVLLQPYLDGVSSRRTSTMAGLALGKATVTTDGPATEPVWREHRLVAFARSADGVGLVETIEQLLADGNECKALGERAAAGYELYFSLGRTVETLRN
jgi:glycosyltransferase involved in cell wall biosynthesis